MPMSSSQTEHPIQPESWTYHMDRATFAAITSEWLLAKGIKAKLTEEEIDAQYETFQYEPARAAWWERLWARLLMEVE